MILETRRMEQIQHELLATYSAIEQCVRSLHPGCEWEECKLSELQAHREKRNQVEQLLMQILQNTSSAKKD
jgi:hypothetical protein